MWRRYPWPGGCADPAGAAWTFTKPKEEWREPLERWLPGYRWPDEPDRAALERILMAAPFNLRPADFNALALPIDRVVALLDIASVARPTDGEFESGQWFTLNTNIPLPRLRQAAKPTRKTKRVRTKRIDGVVCYQLADVRKWWSRDMSKSKA